MTRENNQPRRRDGIICEALGDEMLVFDERIGGVHALNPTATWIFRQIDGQSDFDTLARRFAETCEIDIETAATDVRKTLDDLVARALVQ